MTLPLYSTAFTDNVSTVSADFLNNYVRTQIPKAIDGVGGGIYTPSATVEIQGTAGLKINGTSSAARLQYGSRTITRHLALLADTTSGNWSRTATPRGAWQNTASGGTLDVHLEGLPNAGTLATITVRWKGAAGHGAFPGGAPTMPNIELFKIAEDGTETSLGNVSDTSATAGAYETAHDITLTSISHTIDRTLYRYVLVVTGELGGNFIANAKLLGLKAAVGITDQTEW